MSSTHTILVADDEVDLCKTLERVLAKEGYRVLTAHEGEKALALLKEEGIHLLLLDLKMPGLGGLEVLQRVRKDYPSLAVVIMTAYGSLASAREAMQLGAVDYLTKPFDLNVVRAVVKEALSGG